MKQLVVLSGKGGTGKTTVTGAFVNLAKNKGFADCDVDAPNLHLLLSKSKLLNEDKFYALKRAVKYDEECINCGKCEENCKFDAIKNGKVIPYLCEGCGVCELVCPVKNEEGKSAIRMEEHVTGITYLSKCHEEFFSHAQLSTGSGASGKLVSEVREKLTNCITNEKLVIIDGSPGIGCPVIASVTGVDAALIVTEPSLSGLHDLKRIIDVAKQFNVACAICINKYDINSSITKEIEEFSKSREIYIAGKIPYDSTVIDAVNNNKSIIEYKSSSAAQAINKLWINICNFLNIVDK